MVLDISKTTLTLAMQQKPFAGALFVVGLSPHKARRKYSTINNQCSIFNKQP